MRYRSRFWLSAVLFSALLFPSAALADTIRITSGSVVLGGTFDLTGDRRGFHLTGDGYGGGSAPAAYVFCENDECSPGAVAQLRHAFGGLDLFVASATLDGVAYEEVNSLGAPAFAEIGFSSTHELPAFSTTAVLRTPFMMEGFFSHPGGVETLRGSGIVTTTWFPSAGSGAAVWNLGAARYDFSDPAPIPEPGTLVLAGIGLAATAFRRRKRTAPSAG